MSLALGRLLLEDYSPSICFNVMSSYSAWGPIYHFFDTVGVAPITMSQTQFDFRSVRFNNPISFVTKGPTKGSLDHERIIILKILNERSY